MRALTLALTLGMGLATSLSHAARFPSWATERIASADLERYHDADAVILYAEWKYRLSGGARRGTERKILHLLTEEGEKEASFVLPSSELRRYENTLRDHLVQAGCGDNLRCPRG